MIPNITDIVDRRLREFRLQEHYPKEEPDLLDHVESEIRDVLGSGYTVVSRSWDSADSVSAFGGTFWPDILVRRDSNDLVALELKLVKEARRSPTKALAEMIGQCLVYRAKYPDVIGFLVNQGLNDPNVTHDTVQVVSLLNAHDIRIVVRQNQHDSVKI